MHLPRHATRNRRDAARAVHGNQLRCLARAADLYPLHAFQICAEECLTLSEGLRMRIDRLHMLEASERFRTGLHRLGFAVRWSAIAGAGGVLKIVVSGVGISMVDRIGG